MGLLSDESETALWNRVCDAAVKALEHIGTPEALVAEWRQARGDRP
jgi:hypothetical protein